MDKKAIETLRHLAKTNKAADAVFHDFATRQRARGQVTVRALHQRLKNEGFSYGQGQYAEVLKALANAGIGEARTGKTGRLVAIVGIRATLASIGRAVIGNETVVRPFRKRPFYQPLPSSTNSIAAPPNTEAKREIVNILSGVDNLVRTVLNDASVPAGRRIEAAMALLKGE